MNTREYQTVEQIGYEAGVYFTMEVYKLETGGYRCYGYAMASGVKLTHWHYYALDQEEAYEQATKDYLIKELRLSVRIQLTHLAGIAKEYLNPSEVLA